MDSNSTFSLKKQGENLYRDGVMQVLPGYQLLEEQLKTYLEVHFDLTRAILANRLHFDFKRDDYQDAALGRLVHVFSKLCANKDLVLRLRAVVKNRDHIAHQALVKLYKENISTQEYSGLIEELNNQMNTASQLMTDIAKEMKKMGERLGDST